MDKELRESTISIPDINDVLKEREKLEMELENPWDLEDLTDALRSHYRKKGENGQESMDEEGWGKGQELLAKILKRIMKETTISNEIGDFLNLEELADLQKFSQIHNLKFSGKLGKNVGGQHDRSTGEITLTKEAERLKNPWRVSCEIAFSGLPLHINTLLHEMVHRLDADPPAGFKLDSLLMSTGLDNQLDNLIVITPLAGQNPSMFWMMVGLTYFATIMNKRQEMKEHNIISEVHAYSTSGFASMFESLSLVELSEHLKRNYKYNSQKNFEQITSAFQDIRRLKVLGLTDTEIGELVRESKWDKKSSSFGTLHTEVERLVKEKDIDPFDLDTAADIKMMQLKNEGLKIKKIAQEELTKAVDEIAGKSGEVTETAEDFTGQMLAA